LDSSNIRRKTLISDNKSHADSIPATTDFLEDEELIEQILKKSSGQEYQSEIVKQSALLGQFSASKNE
jgi:hypothetical protein